MSVDPRWMAADFFVVPTVTFRLLFLVVPGHDRRRMAHVAVTDHPTAARTAQQLRSAFSEDQAAKCFAHDGAFASVAATLTVQTMKPVGMLRHTTPTAHSQRAAFLRVRENAGVQPAAHMRLAADADSGPRRSPP